MPDESMLRTPAPPRRPAEEALQHELTMTAGILRSAQSRLAEEREERLRARAGEELAMVDIRRAREEARQLKDERRAQDRKHMKVLADQRKALEMELKRAEGEQEAAIAALKREREQTAEMLREAHADHTRELEEQLAFAQEERELLLQEAQRVREQEAAELAKKAQREIEAQLDADKEKRIAHLQGVGVRRLLKKGLARGWMAWVELYKDRRRRRALLVKAGHQLLRPKLTAVYTHWRHSWQTFTVSQASMTHEQRLAHEVKTRRALEAELLKVQEELKAAQEILNKEKYTQESLRLEMSRKLDDEKTKRVEALGQQGLKRLMSQKLSMGWSAWHAKWSVRTRQRNLLKKAGARLSKPKLIASYKHWAADWKDAMRIKSTMTAEQQATAVRAERAEFEAKLLAQVQQLQKDLKHARDALASGKGLEDELKRRMEEELEREKEKRVENIGKMGLKRLMNQKLSMGWSALHSLWSEARRQRNLLKKAGARLIKPKLMAAYSNWKSGWSFEMARDKTMTIGERLAAEITRADAAEEQARLTARELKAAREAMAAGVGQEAEIRRKMEEELEREKEKRVAHLGEMGVRRLMNQGLTRGWSAWHGLWSESKRQRSLLKKAGVRLVKPKLIHSFQLWMLDWKANEAKLMMTTAEQRAAQIVADKAKKEQDLAMQVAELQKELEAAHRRLGESHQGAEERLRRIEADLEAEKDKRVANLGQVGLKRLMNQKLAMGWLAWHAKWAEKRRQKNVLKKAGARLTKPKLIASYQHWRHDWAVVRQTRKSMSIEERAAAEVEERDRMTLELKQELDKVKAELQAARDAMLAGKGHEAEMRRVMEEQVEKEREKRIEALGTQGLKRLVNQKLAIGWSAWHDMWFEYRRQRNLLKQAGVRMTKPKLSAAYAHWNRDWRTLQASRAAMTAEQRLATEAGERAQLMAELQKQVDKLSGELQAARTAMIAGKGQEAETQRLLQEQLEKEKEKRVEALGQQGLKRIMNQKLAMGWAVWHDMWATNVKQRNLLKKAGARLVKPKLIASYQQWKAGWQAEMKLEDLLAHEQKLMGRDEEMRRVEAENAKLRKQLEEARNAMVEGKGFEAEMKRKMEEQLEKEKEKRVEALGQQGLKRIMNQKLAMGWAAWHDMWAANVKQRNLLKKAGARLTKPKLILAYTQWRRDWEIETHQNATLSTEQKLLMEIKTREQLEKENAELRREVERLRAAAIAGNAMEKELKRKYEEELEREKDARVAHLGNMGLKRLMNQGLARGWAAWHSLWSNNVRQRNLLKKAGMRITKPKLMNAYSHWLMDWKRELKAERMMTAEQKAAAELDRRAAEFAALEAKYDKVRKELVEARDAMAKGLGLEYEQRKKMEEQLEKEREARVEHLGQMGIKRLMNQKLSMGWAVWHTMCSEATHQRNLLKKASARLTKPKLIQSYALWRRDWEISANQAATMSTEQKLLAAQEAERNLLAEVRELRRELESMRELALQGKSTEAELRRRHEEELERQKEARVAHLGEMGIKRLMNQKLAMGWAAWHGMWSDKVRKRNLLKQAGARLTKPKMIASYSQWRRDWEAEESARYNMTTEERRAKEAEEKARLLESLQTQVDKLSRELKEAREAMMAGRGLQSELQRQAEEELEREREKRVAHLGQLGMKRLMNQKLALGWAAWHGKWSEKKRKKNLLKQAGARLTKPRLIQAYTYWIKDWTHEIQTLGAMTMEQRYTTERDKAAKFEAELVKLRDELAAARAAMLSGEGQAAELKRLAEEQLEAEKAKRVEALGTQGLKRLMNQKLALGWTAWHGMWSDQVRKRNLLKQAGARLTKPKLTYAYKLWRRDWEIEAHNSVFMSTEQKLLAATNENEQLSTELKLVRTELEAMRKAALSGRAQEAELQRQLEEELERERAARVEHLGQLGIKRLMNQKLALGWSAWHDMWSDRVKQRNLLKKAAARLTKPKLIAAYQHWVRGWDAEFSALKLEKARLAALSESQRLALEISERKNAEEELARLRQELKQARSDMAAGIGYEVERKRQMEEELERERQRRVEHLGRVGMKRLLNQKLALGWSGWHDMWAEKVNQRNLLKKAAARLTKPKLISSYSHWRRSWEVEVQQQGFMTTEQKLVQREKEINQLEAGMAKLRRELQEARDAMIAGRGHEAELERRMQEQLEREKEKRVEALGQQGLKRIMNKALAMGWTAWLELWSEKVRQRNLLKKAGARLLKPKLIASYQHWRKSWEVETQKEELITREERIALEAQSKLEMKRTIDKLQADLKAANELLYGAGGLSNQLEQELEAEREKRVQHLSQLGVKRLMNQKLTLGWLGWHDMWSEKMRQRNLLKKASARLTKPRLIQAYTHWMKDWNAVRVARKTMSITERLALDKAEAQQEKEALYAQVDKLSKELKEARDTMLAGRGMEAELKRLAEERLEAEKAKRVEALGTQGLKRLMNQKLALGWTGWHALWSERVRQRNLLKKASARLVKPKLIASYQQWRHDWEIEQRKKMTMSTEQKLLVESQEKEKLLSEVNQLRKELEGAREAMISGRGQEEELKRRMEEKLEAERAKRIEHLGQQGLRRILKQGIAKAWSAWFDMYSTKLRKQRMLKHAALRLTKPKLSAAYQHWMKDWDVELATSRAEELRLSKMSSEERLALEMKQAKNLREQNAQLQKELKEAREVMLAGRGQEAELKRLAEEELEREREKRVAHLGEMGVKRLMNQGLARGWSGWHALWAEKVRQRSLLKKAASRLTKPKLISSYTHWRRDWELELRKNRFTTTEEKLLKKTEEAASLFDEVKKLKAELEKARASALAGRGEEAELKRLAEEELEREREKRVAHLGEMGVKRLMNQGLARGWSGWHALWAEKVRQRSLLKKAASRLLKPKQSAAYAHWRRSWSIAEAAKKTKEMALSSMSLKERIEYETAMRLKVEGNLAKALVELREMREAALAGTALEQELRKQFEEKLHAEKEERVMALQQVGIKRLINRDVARGWSTWHHRWQMYSKRKNMLLSSLARLMKPRLVKCFGHWMHDWDLTMLAKSAKSSQAALSDEGARAKAEKDATQAKLGMELEKLRKELADAREAMLAGRGMEAEQLRLIQEQLEAEREKRVVNLGEMGVKRLMNRKLALGWTAWHVMWYEKVRQRNLLKKASARLVKPKLIASYQQWRHDWERESVEKRRKLMMSESERRQEELKAHLEDLESDYSARLSRETERRQAVEEELKRRKVDFEEQLALTHVALVEARRAATDAINRAAVERASADAGKRATAEAAEAERARMLESAKRENAEQDLRRFQQDTDEELALQHVALIEARKAATDALSRLSLEQAQAQAARRQVAGMEEELKKAISQERAAQAEVGQMQNLLQEHQMASEEKLNRLLEEHRTHLTKEIVRLSEDYERQLAELRLQIVRASAVTESMNSARREMSPMKVRSLLVFDPSKNLWQTLVHEIKEKGLRLAALFSELDENSDGYVTREEWIKGFSKMGPSFPRDVLSAGFDQCDKDKSDSIDYQELEKWVKEFNPNSPTRSNPSESQPNPAPTSVPAPPAPSPNTGEPKKKKKLTKEEEKKEAEAKKKGMKQVALLTAMASQMGIRPEKQWYDDAVTANTVGDGHEDFQAMMIERANSFGHADLNNDGKLDFEEFKDLVKYRETTVYTEKQLREKFDEMDEDASGEVTLPEFIYYSLKDSLRRSKGRAIDLFRIWDEDESGYIDKNEFGKALVALGFVANREDLNTVFDMLDEDGSGQIDYNELNKMLKKGAGSAAAAAKKERPRSASSQDEKAPVKKTDQPGPAKKKNDKKP